MCERGGYDRRILVPQGMVRYEPLGDLANTVI